MALLELAQDLDPDSVAILADLAMVFQTRGMEEEARDVFLRVQQLDPSHPTARVVLDKVSHSAAHVALDQTVPMPKVLAYFKKQVGYAIAPERLYGLVCTDISDFAALNRMSVRHWEIADDDRIPLPDWSCYPEEWEDFAVEIEERMRRGLVVVENAEFLARFSPATFDVFTDKTLLRERDYYILGPEFPHMHSSSGLSVNLSNFQEAVIGLRGSSPPIVIEDPVVFLNHCPTYGHFLGDVLPKLCVVYKDEGLRALPIYSPPLLDYQRELIDLLGLSGLNFREVDIPLGSVLHLKRGFLPGHIPYPFAVKWIRDRYAAEQGLSGRRNRRLFLSRANMVPEKRRLENEDEIFAFLERRGFERIFPSAMPVKTVVELVSEAEVIVSPVGSTETSSILAQPGTVHIQLAPEDFVKPEYIYWRSTYPLFAYFQVDFHRVLGKSRRDAAGSVIDKPLTIDTKDLAAVLDQVGITEKTDLFS
ncbi:glycosyltransferase 61 family protein [Rhodospirillum sp. A1_3_36]|uniref:glycosyltransferase 61 family protein n=1 Tax=Rhodospirillum sp. A1_3_36 TaxID=3391666 RepID=UPI0039A5A586